MLRHPILSYVLLNIASNYLPRMIRTIARKAYTLLKNAKTKTKRVDIIIPVEDNSLLIVRTIGFEPFETFKGIPEPDELCQALISAMQKLGRIRGKQTGKLLLMEAMVSKKESQISVRISRRLDSKLGPALKQQIENAKSEKPVSLNLEAPNLKKQQRSRKQKTPKGRR